MATPQNPYQHAFNQISKAVQFYEAGTINLSELERAITLAEAALVGRQSTASSDPTQDPLAKAKAVRDSLAQQTDVVSISQNTLTETPVPPPPFIKPPPPPIPVPPTRPPSSPSIPPAIPPITTAAQIATKAGLSFQKLGFQFASLFRGAGFKIASSTIASAFSGGATLAINLAISLKKQVQRHSGKLGAIAIATGALSFVVPVAAPIAIVSGLGAFAGGGVSAFSVGASIVVSGIFAILGTSLTVAAAPIAISIVVLPLLIAFIMLIINNSAFMVPPGESISYDSESFECEYEGDTGCYVFDSSWDSVPNRKETVACAIQFILRKPESETRICNNGAVTVKYRPTGLLAGGMQPTGTRDILVSPLGTDTAVYTMSHESGHIIYNDGTDSIDVAYLYRLSGAKTEGWLPSYRLPEYASDTEDAVESLGLWMMHPEQQHSKVGNLQANYPRHFKFAESVFGN